MPARRYRSAYACASVVALTAVDVARADEPDLEAKMQCERAVEPGRVRCSVEVRASAPKSIAWADVAIVQLPEVASALKGRIGQDVATARDASSVKWAFGLVARRAGQGEARARVRAVVCAGGGADGGRGASRCVPRSIEVRAALDVGG